MLARLFDRAVPQVAVSHRLPQHAPAPHGSSNQQRAAVHTWARGKRRRDAGPFPSLGADTEVEDFILEDEGVHAAAATATAASAAAAGAKGLDARGWSIAIFAVAPQLLRHSATADCSTYKNHTTYGHKHPHRC
jgi:hypothetical protein